MGSPIEAKFRQTSRLLRSVRIRQAARQVPASFFDGETRAAARLFFGDES